jgi:hypothetical protein
MWRGRFVYIGTFVESNQLKQFNNATINFIGFFSDGTSPVFADVRDGVRLGAKFWNERKGILFVQHRRGHSSAIADHIRTL